MKKLLFTTIMITASVLLMGQDWAAYYGQMPTDTATTKDSIQFLVIDAEDDSTFYLLWSQMEDTWEGELVNEAGLYSALSDVTQFLEAGDAATLLDGTAHRLLYVDGSGNITELAFGADGTVLTSTGASTAPAFESVAGTGDLLSTNNLSDLTSASTALTNLGLTASAAEINHTAGVTSNIQTQLDAKANAGDSIVTVYRNGITATESVTGDSMFVDVDDVDLTSGVTGVLPVGNLPTQTTITDTDASIPTSGAVVDYVAANGGTGDSSSVSYTFIPTASITPSEGEVYYDSDNNLLLLYNGVDYDTLNTAGTGGNTDTTYLHYRIDSLATALAAAEATIATFSSPSLSSAELGTYNDSIVVALFNKNLYGGSMPATTDFTLTEDGNTHGVNAVSISYDTLFLALDSAGAFGSTYLLDYDPGTNILSDSSGNWVLAWMDRAVTNNIITAGSNLVSNGTFDDGTGWSVNAPLTISAGVVNYDSTGIGVLEQNDVDMNSSVQPSTSYTAYFDVNVSGEDNVEIQLFSTNSVVYSTLGSYNDGSFSTSFTTPSDVGDGGIRVRFSPWSDCTFDNLELIPD